MASVVSKTSIKIDDLVNLTVVNGYVTPGGQLILVTRDGHEIMAGTISRAFEGIWSSTLTYVAGDVVGYAGGIWQAKNGSTNKPPPFYTSLWDPLTGEYSTDWAERDPFFIGDNLTESWDFTNKVGAPSASLTSVSGEFETGKQALRIVCATDEVQSFFQKEENIVRGGEIVTTTIRAKLLSSAPNARLDAMMIQADETELPIPPSPGYDADKIYTPSLEGPQTLGTDWLTYKFTFTAGNAKPRAIVDCIASAGSDSGASFVFDYVLTEKAEASADTDDFELTKEFASAANPWIFTHRQGTKAVNVYTEDAFGNELRGDVSYPDDDNVQVDFYHAQTGLMRVFN